MAKNDNVYDNTFQTVRYFHPRLFIPYINRHFGKDYPMDAEIKMMTRDGRLIERRADGNIAITAREADMIMIIRGDVYLIECQSYNDEMEIRIAEYAFMSASKMAKHSEDGTLTIEMPRYSIVYVRPNSATPKETRIRFIFPDGQNVDYISKNTLLSDYSKEDIIEQKLFPFIPFYVTRYENQIKNEDGDITEILSDLEYMYNAMQRYVSNGELYGIEASDLAQLTKDVVAHIANGNSNEERLVNKMGGRIIITPAQQMLIDNWNGGKTEGLAEGMAEGMAKGKAEDILELLEDFGEVSDPLRDMIMSQKDLEKLSGWFKHAAHSSSIEEFEERINDRLSPKDVLISKKDQS